MKYHHTLWLVFGFLYDIACETFENQPQNSNENNLHLVLSTFQLQKLLEKESQMVQDLKEYMSLLSTEMIKVKSFLHENYFEYDVAPKNIKGTLQL